jgi:SNF2 family DNA or RNA helicase
MPLPKGLNLSAASLAMLRDSETVDPCDKLHLGLNADGNKFIARINRSVPGYQPTFAGPRSCNWATATPGFGRVKKSQHVQGSYYTFHVSDFTVLRVENSWNKEQVTFEDQHTELTYTNCLMRFLAGEANAARFNAWLEDGKSVALPIELKPDTVPNSYQSVAALNAITAPGFAMLMEQGTGKTFAAIIAAAYAAKQAKKGKRFFRGLVVCPNNVRLNWEREIAKFSPIPIKAKMVIGGLPQRIATVHELFVTTKNQGEHDGAVAIVSYASAAELCRLFTLLQIDALDVCVVDESHTIKNPSAGITKSLLAARGMFRKRIILTGTPIGNSIYDLWSQLEFLYPGCSGFTTFPDFKKYYSKPVPQYASSVQRLDAALNMPLLRERIARNAFVVTKAQALPHLPALMYEVVTVPLTKQQKLCYKRLATELALSITDDLEGLKVNTRANSDRNILIQNALTKSLKLTQVISGFLKYDAVKDPVTEDIVKPAWFEEFNEVPKLDWLVEQIKEAPKTEKFIVWACQTYAQDMILRRLAAEGIVAVRFNGETSEKGRQEAVDTFNDEALKTRTYDPTGPNVVRVMVANQAAAGPGLNLLGYPIGRPDLSPCNACRVIRYVYDYSRINRAQSDARAHRVGTREPVRVQTLVGFGTVEVKINEALDAKEQIAFGMTDVEDILNDMVRGNLDAD